MPTPLASMNCRPMSAPRTVLILDASAALGLSLIRSLRRYGVSAVLATSGAQALQTCKKHEVVAVVFHDDALGGRHHLATLQRVHPRLPIAMVGSDPGPARAVELGVEPIAYFSKPLEATEVLETLKAWIEPMVPRPVVPPPVVEVAAGAGWGPAPDQSARPTRRVDAVDDDILFGEARTAQLPAIDNAVAARRTRKTATLCSVAVSRATGSYSIVNRRLDTQQFARI